MRRPIAILAAFLAVFMTAGAVEEVPAGSRFVVELRDTLKAKKVKRGKRFEARTLEAVRTPGGLVVPPGAKLRGTVTHVERDGLLLRFEQIRTPYGERPLVATVTRVLGEKRVRESTNAEGEIRAEGNRGRNAAVGAAVGGGIGAAVGASQAGGRGAALGGASGAGLGAVIGAAAGGAELELLKGTRLELQLERPLLLR